MHANALPGLALEAARYAVLRRVGPALRHDLVVHLQTLAIQTEVVVARLERGLPSRVDLQQQLEQIQRGAREAIAQSLRVATWLVPPDDDAVDLRSGVQECLALVRSGLARRGFSVQADVPDTDFQVSCATLRPLLLSALMHLSDRAGPPGDLRVDARVETQQATLALTCRPTGSARAYDPQLPYRPLALCDLQALAAAHGSVAVQVHADRLDLQVARLVPTTPLQIAPL